MSKDTRKMNPDLYNITPEQVELFLNQSAESFAKADKDKATVSFVAKAISELLNKNKKADVDNLKSFINEATWEKIIKGEIK